MVTPCLSEKEIADFPGLLQNALSSDNCLRTQAEERIEHLTARRGFLEHLARYACCRSPNIPQCQRLIALTILKQKVGHGALEEDIEVMGILMNLLLWEGDRHIVNVSSATLSTITAAVELGAAANPTLSECLNSLMSHLTDALAESGSAIHHLNFVILISELIANLPMDSDVRECILSLVPALLRIVFSNTSGEASCIAVGVVRDVILSVLTARKKPSVEFVKETWASFFPALSAVMRTPCRPADGREDSLLRNRLTLGILVLLEDMFCTAKWTRQSYTVDLFHDSITCIRSEDAFYFDAKEKDDEESVVIQQVMAKRWSFLGEVARMKSFRSVLETVVGANSQAFLNLVLLHTMLSDIEAEEWLNEANVFLRHEEEQEDEVAWNVRATATDVCRLCVPVLGSDLLQFLVGFLNTADHSWKERESVLFLLEVLLRRCPREMVSAGVTSHTFLLQAVLEKDVTGPAILASRALSLLGVMLTLMKREGVDVQSLSASLLPKTVVSLVSSAPLLRAAACKLLHRLLPLVHQNDTLTSFAEGQDALFSLMLSETTTDEFLYLCLEVYTEWISRCHTVRRDVAPPDAHYKLLCCWKNHIQDPNIGELVVSLFGELITEPAGDASFAAGFSWMSDVLNGRCGMAEYCAVPFVIQMLTCVFAKGSDDVTVRTAESLVGSLCGLLLTTEESSILASASNCLSALLQRCPQAGTATVFVPPSAMGALYVPRIERPSRGVQVAPSIPLDEEPQPYLLSAVFVVIATSMLAAERKEVSLMNAGKVLVAIAENTGGFRDDELACLITTIVSRLKTVRTDTIVQELVAPLAVLLKRHLIAFINVLMTSWLLVDMFSVWLPKMGVFWGKEDLLRSCDALLELLLEYPMDKRLHGLMVPWSEKKGKKLSLPLDVALFLAVGKGVLNLLSQGCMEEEDESDDEDEWADGKDDEEEEEEEEEVEESNKDVAGHVGSAAGEMPRDVLVVLQRVPPLVPHYGAVTAQFFSRSELNTLSVLFTRIQAAATETAP
ncbi:hypothetical protein DQ04_02651070 [Trypanosoma grayi]|uniref:hypothetical protein n=1 Tax=Trypanosoma grayi TaxID=71804 RepID=UPI0004F43E0A|nr:hypothetical protein DQ04_02651070 [Trypanosoma grayi]KEG11409.1 hypothetical protein DQ04_02651070 [Trypanosoma grayi]